MRQVIPIIAFIIAVAAMGIILVNGVELDPSLRIIFSVACIIGIGACSIIGLFEKSLMKYVFYSTIIQFFYFLLDVSTALLIEKSVWFAIIQFINFIIAGGLFAIVIAMIYNEKKTLVPDYAGLYDKNQFLVLTLCIACLSLGGMPGFNIFVGEYIIYASLFTIHPALTIGAIFAGLLCFIFYFRICYVMFAGKSETKIGLGLIQEIVVGILAILVVGLGILPDILMRILEWYT